MKIVFRGVGFRLLRLLLGQEHEAYERIRKKVVELGNRYGIRVEEVGFEKTLTYNPIADVIRYNPKTIYKMYVTRKVLELTLDDFITHTFGHELAHRKSCEHPLLYVYLMADVIHPCVFICSDFYAIKFNLLKIPLVDENHRMMVKETCMRSAREISIHIRERGEHMPALLASIPAYLHEDEIRSLFHFDHELVELLIYLRRVYTSMRDDPEEIVSCIEKCKELMGGE